MSDNNKRSFTKSELLTWIKKEIELKTTNDITIKSLSVIADILNIDLSDAVVTYD